ncbi:tyrosine-type recombinase/integrase [Roseomonas sp. NAR14]|uniref:Tyrosine-type recombinase/integrase n=1 Tax=Roseomonas acroporae TaxID=2937791 RepID=A0A9X2BUJ2_9PROT|nr:integrase arm-type DNA-binding domain-containing protein [Roseomonas acroporae]MCK8784151.1 tyrosine-type recombinase/integrase [Roseomonas acroporae]
MAGKLTALGARALVTPGRYTDGGGLHLHVRAADRRAWVFRYTRDGKTRDMGLGPFPEVTLAKARELADIARSKLREGLDPLSVQAQAAIERRAEAGGHTFRAAAEAYIAAQRDGWRNPKHQAQWSSTLDNHAYPAIGDMPVKDVDVEAVLRVLKPIWTKTPETASRLRGRIEQVLDAAKARGWRTGENPARWKGVLSGLLPPRGRIAAVEHQPSLPWQRIGAFMAALRDVEGVSAQALALLILTAARTGEVLDATWREFDLEAAVWTVPAARMKAKRLHRVPLSAPALELLRRLLPLRSGPAALLFPGQKADRPLSDMALTMLVRRMNKTEGDAPPPWRDIGGRAIVPHGFRSTFRVWAGEQTRYPREVVETALAHVNRDKVEAAYARTDLLERRRPLMEEWGAWCMRP